MAPPKKAREDVVFFPDSCFVGARLVWGSGVSYMRLVYFFIFLGERSLKIRYARIVCGTPPRF